MWFLPRAGGERDARHAGRGVLDPTPTGLSWMYWAMSESSTSSAARNRRIAASPGVRPPLAEAVGGSANSRPAPMVAAPTAAPLSKNERRLLRCVACSVASMVVSLRKPGPASGRRFTDSRDASEEESAAGAGQAGRRCVRTGRPKGASPRPPPACPWFYLLGPTGSTVNWIRGFSGLTTGSGERSRVSTCASPSRSCLSCWPGSR